MRSVGAQTMNKPNTLTSWDFPDTKHIPDGYDMKQIPECTTDNFNRLLEHYNNLVDVVNLLTEKAGLKLDEE